MIRSWVGKSAVGVGRDTFPFVWHVTWSNQGACIALNGSSDNRLDARRQCDEAMQKAREVIIALGYDPDAHDEKRASELHGLSGVAALKGS
jgi:hypothetical protein